MSIRNESFEIRRIETGYLIHKYDYDTGAIDRAFTTWDEVLKFLKTNPPKRVEKLTEQTVETVLD